MKRILFVDDEDSILAGLQRMLRPMRNAWDMQFANGGQQALRTLEQQPVDVIVSDIRMAGLDGVELLTEVKRLYPETVRIVLSGYTDQELTLRSVGPAHQFLAKPCSADLLKSTIDRACALQERLRGAELQMLVARLGSLPSLPTLYVEVLAEIRSPEGSLESIGRIVSKDVAMTAKILQLVNSAFFGVRQPIADPALAASFLGLETLKALVLSAQVFSTVGRDAANAGAIAKLGADCTRIAAFARQIAREERAPREIVEHAFFAGMLCEIGKLVLLTNLRDEYTRVRKRAAGGSPLDLELAEIEAFGASHADIGAYLLGIWGLPGVIVESIAFHHHPSRVDVAACSPLTFVHAASAIHFGLESGSEAVEAQHFDAEFVARLELAPRLEAWRAACRRFLDVQS